MTIEVDPAEPIVHRHVPGIIVAAVASAGAGAVHLAAGGAHADHPTVARSLVIVGVAQLCAGLWALLRAGRPAAAALGLVNVLAVGGWLATRLTGVSGIEGLATREAPGFADAGCALLGVVAAGAAIAAVVVGWQTSARPPRLSLPSLAVAALAIPAMVVGGTDVHSHTAGASADHAADHAALDAQEHDHPDTAATHHAGDAGATVDGGTERTHPSGAPDAGAGAAAVPYDPTAPIDLSGVPGVTPAQQAAAENLVAVTLVRLPQWADPATAEAAGFHSIGDAGSGHEHYVNWEWIDDAVVLDPDHPESLVYEPQPDGTKRLVSAMYMLPSSVALADVPNIGGALMQWHIHDDLCFTNDPVAPQVRGVVGADGTCPAGLRTLPPAPMIHVWITPHPCGPFAALEGVGAGQILDGEERLCDHAHGDGLL